jgi:hypothetical protein
MEIPQRLQVRTLEVQMETLILSLNLLNLYTIAFRVLGSNLWGKDTC